MSLYVLTDKYLMKLPLSIADLKEGKVKEIILVELTD